MFLEFRLFTAVESRKPLFQRLSLIRVIAGASHKIYCAVSPSSIVSDPLKVVF
jgi:hypothetical protein